MLKWPTEVAKAGFLCSFTKIVARAIEKYTNLLLEPFQRLEKETWTTDRAMELTPDLCIRINNLYETYRRFEKLVNEIDVSHYCAVLSEASDESTVGSVLGEDVQYRLEIMRARGLLGGAGRVEDYYVKLFEVSTSDPGHCLEIGRTSIVKDCTSGDPTWNQAFTMSAPKATIGTVEIQIQVCDRERLRKDRLRGDTKLLLSSTDLPHGRDYSPEAILVPNLDDFLPHEVVIPLDAKHARLWVRIQRCGHEQDPRVDDDMRFWITRTALALENALITMIRVVTEHVTRYTREACFNALGKLLAKPYLNPESLLEDCLHRLDGWLGTINMFMEKEVGLWISERSDVADGIDSEFSELENDASEGRYLPNLLALHIWRELLKSISGLPVSAPSWVKRFGGLKARASSEERRRLRIIADEIELMKSLMYCESRCMSAFATQRLPCLTSYAGDGLRHGFDIKLLEKKPYTDLRYMVL